MADCTCNRRGRRIDHNLAYRFRSKRACRLVAAFKFHPDIAHIQTAWDFILHKGIAVIFSFCIIDDIFIHGHSDSLRKSSLCLYSRQTWIHYRSTIYYCHIINQFQFSGFFVNLHFRHSNHKRRRWNRWAVCLTGIERLFIVAHHTVSDFRSRNGCTCFDIHNTLSVKIHIVHITSQVLCTFFAKFVF